MVSSFGTLCGNGRLPASHVYTHFYHIFCKYSINRRIYDFNTPQPLQSMRLPCNFQSFVNLNNQGIVYSRFNKVASGRKIPHITGSNRKPIPEIVSITDNYFPGLA